MIRTLSRSLLAFAAIASLLQIADSVGQTRLGPVAVGRHLAEQFCTPCHLIAPTGFSSWTDAPDFDAIAHRRGVTAQQLSAIIQEPHMHMLNTERPPGEADAIAAYIMSLRRD